MREALVVIGSVLLGYNLLAGHLRAREKERKITRAGNYIFGFFVIDKFFWDYNYLRIIKRTTKRIYEITRGGYTKVFSLLLTLYGCWEFPFGFDVRVLLFSRLGFCFLFSILGFLLLGSVDFSTE